MRSKNLYLPISQNKGIELEALYNPRSSTFVHFLCSWTRRQDHAGISVEIGILSFELSARLVDSRHWDYQNNRWESGS